MVIARNLAALILAFILAFPIVLVVLTYTDVRPWELSAGVFSVLAATLLVVVNARNRAEMGNCGDRPESSPCGTD